MPSPGPHSPTRSCGHCSCAPACRPDAGARARLPPIPSRRSAGASGPSPSRPRAPTASWWPTGNPSGQRPSPDDDPDGKGRGRHHWGATVGPSRGKLRGRAPSPKTLLFAPGSTTPAEQANPVPAGRQCHTGLETFIRDPRSLWAGVRGIEEAGREGPELASYLQLAWRAIGGDLQAFFAPTRNRADLLVSGPHAYRPHGDLAGLNEIA